MNKPIRNLCIASGVLVASSNALWAQTPGSGPEAIVQKDTGGATIFAGLRVWANKWEIPSVTRRLIVSDPADPTSARLEDVGQTTVSDTEFAPIVSLGVRYNKFVASTSYMFSTSYDSKGTLNGDVDRKEFDINFGYHVLPEVILSIGYKRGKVDKLSPDVSGGSKAEAILIGISASKGLTGNLSLYGNAAYGVGRTKADFRDAEGDRKDDLRYRIGEIGFAYAFNPRLHLTLGYRAQVVEVRDTALGIYSPADPTTPVAIRHSDLQTTTDGFVLGLVGVF